MARRLELGSVHQERAALEARVARALTLASDAASVSAMVAGFTLEECLTVLRGYIWEGVRLRFHLGPGAERLQPFEARALLAALAEGERADLPHTTLEQLCTSPGWGGCFVASAREGAAPDGAPRTRSRVSQTAAPEPRAPGHQAVALLFVPVLLLLVVAGWGYRLPLERRLASVHIPLEGMSALLLGFVLLVLVAEALYPESPEWSYRLFEPGSRGAAKLGRDLLYVFGIAQLTALAVFGMARLAAPFVLRLGLHPPRLTGFSSCPAPIRVALAFFAVELFSYGLHRACHRVGWLWRFHRTHHVVTELTGLKALRTHPVDNVLFHLARSLPLVLLGASAEDILAVTYLGGMLGILAHANIRVREGVLGWVINFPRYHALHHASDAARSQSNFGCHTVLWDRLFGTFQRPQAARPELGVHPAGPRSLWDELVAPFFRPIP